MDILKLLLACGGDPEVLDDEKRTPSDYAYEQNYLEIVEVLKNCIIDDIKTNGERQATCKLTLGLQSTVFQQFFYFFNFADKILLNNGFVTGEYVVIETTPTPETNHSFKSDHKSNINEYINEWCNGMLQIKHSSLESLESELSNNEYRYVTKRRNRNSDLIDTYIEDFSRESGILTLPSSTGNESSLQVHNSSSSNSTYLSCCSTDTQNIMECNIFSIPDESQLSENFHEKSTEERNSLLDKNINCGTSSIVNESFVSVSEVYKYTDDEEQVVLYEKRILVPKE